MPKRNFLDGKLLESQPHTAIPKGNETQKAYTVKSPVSRNSVKLGNYKMPVKLREN